MRSGIGRRHVERYWRRATGEEISCAISKEGTETSGFIANPTAEGDKRTIGMIKRADAEDAEGDDTWKFDDSGAMGERMTMANK